MFFGYYSICLPSMATPFMAACWEAYVRTGGLGNETYESYGRLPAILVDAAGVIMAEEQRIEAVKKSARETNLARRPVSKPKRGQRWH